MNTSEIHNHIKRLCKLEEDATQDTFLTQEIDNAQKDFGRDVNLPYKESKASQDVTAYQYIYDTPPGFDTMKGITYQQDHYLRPVNQDQWLRLNRWSSYGNPRFYNIFGGSIRFYPTPDSSAPEVALDGVLVSTASSANLSSVAGLEDKGRGIIDSEIIEWQYVSGTSITSIGRGVEGSTVAAHATTGTLYYRELEYTYFNTVAHITSTSVAVEIPERYREALVLYPAARYFYRQEEFKRGDRFMGEYNKIKNQAKSDLGEKSSQKYTTTLDDTSPGVITKDETHPDDSSLTAA